MFIAILLVVVAVGVYIIARSKKNKKNTTVEKLPILAVERAGIIVAYRREDLPKYSTGMLAPTAGMMVFSDVRVPGPTTGQKQELYRLAEQTGRKLVWESEYALYVPYTGGFCTSPEKDAADYGVIVLRKDAALARLQQ